MSFPAYPSYKDARFVGLDQIPAHWDILRFKQVFEEINERSQTGEEELLSVSEYYGVKPRSQKIEEGEHLSRAESLEGYKLCNEGDLVMNIMLAWKRGLGVTDFRGIVSPAYAVFRLIRDASPYYYHHLLRSDEYIGYFKTFSSGVIDSRLRLYPEVFGRLTAIVPPIDEQNRIARFLDHETAKIDALIGEQERLIELLQEKRQAVISHAVTKGLDPAVPMKESGVEWLGEVPKHWEVSKFGFISVVVRGGSPRPAGDPELFDGDYSPWVTVAEITKDDEIYLTKTETCLTKRGSEQCRVFSSGTLLLSNSGATLGVPKILSIDANANDGVVGFEQLRIHSEFAYFFLSSMTGNLRESIKQGSGQPNLNTEIVRSIPVPVPPSIEATEIVEQVQNQRDKFNKLMQEAETGIRILEERRSALISAAVTGKIDVRNWQPPTDESAFGEEVRQAGLETTA